MQAKIDTSDRVSEDQRWQLKLENDDFVKIGVRTYDEFFELCALRFMPPPQARRTDYRWLHYQRAESLKRWSQEDNQALLALHGDTRPERRATAREMRRFRQR